MNDTGSIRAVAPSSCLFCVALHRSIGLTSQIILDDLSALHHKLNALEFGDVLQRVPGNGDDIGVLTLFERTDPILPSQHL